MRILIINDNVLSTREMSGWSLVIERGSDVN